APEELGHNQLARALGELGSGGLASADVPVLERDVVDGEKLPHAAALLSGRSAALGVQRVEEDRLGHRRDRSRLCETRRSLRVGARVPNSGPSPAEIGIPEMARVLEAAGFASLWVSDHVIMPEHFSSPYPFSADGRAYWPSDTPYFDALVALAL